MELTDAKVLALKLMNQHGLVEKGWVFAFDNAKARAGLCSHGRRTISMSRFITEAADTEFVTQIMLHEIAHALVGAYDWTGTKIGHGTIWKQKAAEIGYTGKRTVKLPEGAPLPTRRNNTASRAPRYEAVVSDVLFEEGQKVRTVSGSGKWANRNGVITGRGPKRYTITLDDGRVLQGGHNLVVAR